MGIGTMGHIALQSPTKTKLTRIMASYISIIALLAAFCGSSIAGIVPAAIPVPAPLVAAAPAAIATAPVFGYAKAVPQNVPPHASRVDLSTKVLAAPYVAAAPYIAAPAAAAPYIAAPAAATPFIAAPAAAPYIAAPAISPYSPYAVPAGVIGAAYTGNFAAPLSHPTILG